MTPPAGWLAGTLGWTAATLGAYGLGLGARRLARGAALANPALIAIVLAIAALQLTHTPYATYARGALPVSFFLAPATIALGLPLAENLAHVRRSLAAILVALGAGSLTSALSGMALVKLFGGDRGLALAMAAKAATTPIVIGIAHQIGAQPALSAGLAITGGIIAAVAVEGVLRWLRVDDWRAMGLAAGTAGSGIGASQVAPLHGTAAAFAAIAIGLNGVLTAILAPLLARWV